MIDASVPVTQSVVERFTEQYLTAIDCDIEKQGNRWEVTIPDDAETELPNGRIVLHCGDPSSEADESVELLHPESAFFQRLIAEASERTPAGKITVNSKDAHIELPQWLEESRVAVDDATFTPYYDRTATVILYRIGIETVSEYQTELLQPISLDVRSGDFLPELEQTFLDITSPQSELIECETVELGRSNVGQLIDATRDDAVERVQSKIDEIHHEASRAADAEVEEYRRMQQQRFDELDSRLSNLSARIDKLSESIKNSNDQEDRVELLRKRKELKSEHEDVESELNGIRQRRQQGFPDKQREIRERHALHVVVTPLTITQIEYERGEMEIVLTDDSSTRTLTVGYGSGIGIADEVTCKSCDGLFTERNPLRTIRGGLRCERCSSR